MNYDLSAPADPRLAPGVARCPGPSTREIIERDPVRAPYPITEESYAFLGDADVPFARYTSKSFFEKETDRLWSRVWQWACREEHIPRPGDYIVYDVGQDSALVIRDANGQIRAYVNACPHRGMQFADAGSSGTANSSSDARSTACRGTWTDSLREIPCRWDFPHIKDEEFGLTEVATGTWGGFVFVNFAAGSRAAGAVSRRAAGAFRAIRVAARGSLRRAAHAQDPAGQLEDVHGGLPRGVPRAGDAPGRPAHRG